MNPHLKNNAKYGKAASLGWVALAYALALAAAIASWTMAAPLGAIPAALLAAVAATFVVWGFSLAFANSSIYDPFWSVMPPLLALAWWWQSGQPTSLLHMLCLAVVGCWALRLTRNWALDWPGLAHEDWRYQELRAQNGRGYVVVNLLGIHMFPTLIVFAAMLPVQAVMADGGAPGVAGIAAAVLAFVLGIGAALIQLVADAQMRRFRLSPSARHIYMKEGLWAWSRHPNYFGELLFWFSLWLFGAAALGLMPALLVGGGALAMLGLFVFYSAPAMDKRIAQKRPGYSEHMKNSSMLLLLPPRPKKTDQRRAEKKV